MPAPLISSPVIVVPVAPGETRTMATMGVTPPTDDGATSFTAAAGVLGLRIEPVSPVIFRFFFVAGITSEA